MSDRHTSHLLTLDAIINIALGLLLVAVPTQTIHLLGLPETSTRFYVTLLGAVLLGIGIALLIERQPRARWPGLGLAGAVAINGLGAGALAALLLFGSLEIPLRGSIVLWSVVTVVLGTAAAEVVALIRNRP